MAIVWRIGLLNAESSTPHATVPFSFRAQRKGQPADRQQPGRRDETRLSFTSLRRATSTIQDEADRLSGLLLGVS
jgi:hypothetical protein